MPIDHTNATWTYQRRLALVAADMVRLSKTTSDLINTLNSGNNDIETRENISDSLPQHELACFFSELATNQRRAVKLLNASRVLTISVSHLQFVLYSHLPKE